MSSEKQNNLDNQEIDLSQIFKKTGQFFEYILTSIFKSFLFFKRNIIIVGVLFLLGAGLGFYLDKTEKVYDNQIIVTPNFGSVDYLYAKIDLINSKIINSDTLFLKEIVGIKQPLKLRKIEITPINDVYKFIENRPQNFELIKLMGEDGDVKKIVDESLTSKNYPNHLITYTTLDETTSDKTLQPILNYLNSSDYYSSIQKEYFNNVKLKMVENDSIIKQINGLLNTFSSSVNGNAKSDKLVYYNENSQLNDVINTKDLLVSEQGRNRIALVNLDKIIKDNSSTLNIRNKKGTNGKMKFVLPLLLISLFVLIRILKDYYQTQMTKLNS